MHPDLPPEPGDLMTSSSSPWSSASVFSLPSTSSSHSSTSISSTTPPNAPNAKPKPKHKKKPRAEKPQYYFTQPVMLAMGAGLSVPAPVVPVGETDADSEPGPKMRPGSHSDKGKEREKEMEKEKDREKDEKKEQEKEKKDRRPDGGEGDPTFEGSHDEEGPLPLTDPRDHSLLEHIYNEMHAARFINMEPLALLTNALSLYFIGEPHPLSHRLLLCD